MCTRVCLCFLKADRLHSCHESGAFSGQVTKDITNLSAAAFLSSMGKKTPLTARLSTVVHEKGYAAQTITVLVLLHL